MKLIFLLIFPIMISANWVAKKNFDKNNLGTIWTLQEECENANPDGCFNLPNDFNPNFYSAVHKRKSDVQNCTDRADCQTKSQVECTDKTEYRVIGEGFKETYCTKMLRVSRSETKKVEYEKKQQEEEQKEEQSRQRCVRSLSREGDLTALQIKDCLKTLLMR